MSTLLEAFAAAGEVFDSEEDLARDLRCTDIVLLSPSGTIEEFLNTFEAGKAREVDFGGSGGPLDSILEKDIGSDLFMGVLFSRDMLWFEGCSSSIVPCEDG